MFVFVVVVTCCLFQNELKNYRENVFVILFDIIFL